MTMAELAKLANVSVSTVSKAFHEAPDVSDETKRHIFALAKENGCYGKFFKGKYHKPIIAMVFPEVVSNYYTRHVKLLSDLVEKNGGICVLASDNFSTEKQAELVEYFASYLQVDGIFVFSLNGELKKAYDVPVVSLFSSSDNRVHSVRSDLFPAIQETASILKEYRHRNVAFIGEPLTRKKAVKFKEELSRHELALTVIESSKRFEPAGEDGVRQLLENGVPFSALICAYDYIAYGAIKELLRHGLRVPQDVSVIGIDNLPINDYTETSIASIDTNPEKICKAAWKLMEKKLHSPHFREKEEIVFPCKLIVRESLQPKE